MSKERIRPIVIGILRKENTLFVEEGYDTVKNEIFYRPSAAALNLARIVRKRSSVNFRKSLASRSRRHATSAY